MPRRSRDQIILEILSLCQGTGVVKTKIVYASNLNFTNARGYLALLIKNGLLEAIQGERVRYKTTSKGERVLERLQSLGEIFE
jgi:predicted transcriptional regulator